MAVYPVQCMACGAQDDVVQPMSERGADRPYPVCTKCGGENKRIVTRANLGNLDTAFFKPWWSDNLSKGADPVYIDSRGTWKRKMAEMGVAPYESGHNPRAERKKEERKLHRQIVESVVSNVMSMGPTGVSNEARRLEHESSGEK